MTRAPPRSTSIAARTRLRSTGQRDLRGERDAAQPSTRAVMSEQSRTATADAGSAQSRWTRVVLLAIPLILSTAVHHGILRNYFYSDDFLNLYRIKNEGA